MYVESRGNIGGVLIGLESPPTTFVGDFSSASKGRNILGVGDEDEKRDKGRKRGGGEGTT